jgi:hypothetical protein
MNFFLKIYYQKISANTQKNLQNLQHFFRNQFAAVVPRRASVEVSTSVDGFGGLVVCVPASSSRVRGFEPLDFFCVKNPRPAFLRRGS